MFPDFFLPVRRRQQLLGFKSMLGAQIRSGEDSLLCQRLDFKFFSERPVTFICNTGLLIKQQPLSSFDVTLGSN